MASPGSCTYPPSSSPSSHFTSSIKKPLSGRTNRSLVTCPRISSTLRGYAVRHSLLPHQPNHMKHDKNYYIIPPKTLLPPLRLSSPTPLPSFHAFLFGTWGSPTDSSQDLVLSEAPGDPSPHGVRKQTLDGPPFARGETGTTRATGTKAVRT